jgi:hypothetical protein
MYFLVLFSTEANVENDSVTIAVQMANTETEHLSSIVNKKTAINKLAIFSTMTSINALLFWSNFFKKK